MSMSSFSFFTEIAFILGIGTLMALFMYVLRLPFILGHLLTGILVGPSFFYILRSAEIVHIFSELGITCLLFIVGLHLSPRVFREVGKVALLTGTTQVVGMTVVHTLLLLLLGVSQTEAIFLGFLLSLSSTIVITKVLTDRKDLGKLYGKITIGILLVQDIFATVLITAMPLVAQRDTLSFDTLIMLVVKLILLGFILWGGIRFVLPRLTHIFARSQEFLFLFSVSWGIGLAALFSVAGLSHEVGALVAGVALATSPYHFEISARMKVLRDFFIILFFVLLGSRLGWQGTVQVLVPAMIVSVAILVFNPCIVACSLRAQRYPNRVAWFSALSFTQVSEFSLILLIIGTSTGMVSTQGNTLLTVVTLITMFVSTLLLHRATQLIQKLKRFFPDVWSTRNMRDKHEKESYEILLLGCHRLGQDFLATLKKGDHSFLVIDFDPAVIAKLQEEKIPCRYGDIEDNEFMDELNMKKTKMVISTIPDVSTNLFVIRNVRKRNKNALVLVMAHAVDQALCLYEAGATYVVMPYFIGGNYSSLLIDKYGVNAKKFMQERVHHLKHLQRRKDSPRGTETSEEYKHLTNGGRA